MIAKYRRASIGVLTNQYVNAIPTGRRQGSPWTRFAPAVGNEARETDQPAQASARKLVDGDLPPAGIVAQRWARDRPAAGLSVKRLACHPLLRAPPFKYL